MRDRIISSEVTSVKKHGDTMGRLFGEKPSPQTTTDAGRIRDAAKYAGLEGGFLRGGKETL